MLTKSNRLFLFITLFILLTDSFFVWLNYTSARSVMQEGLKEELAEAHGAFNLALDGSMEMLQQIAIFLASDKRVQELFQAGSRAVEAEGGGAGGEQAERIRQQLFELVGPGWKALTKRYDVRQLHFHLGPGALSFLRVHRREKYGDRLDEIRHTVVDANVLQKPTKGFEIGRPYAGIRGVTPVYAKDTSIGSQGNHIGALEVGSSFPQIFNLLKRHTQIRFTVLLKHESLQSRVWPESLSQLYDDRPPHSGFYIEASSDEAMTRTLLGLERVHQSIVDSTNLLIEDISHPIAIASFPLYDYKGTQLLNLDSVGQILVWRDASGDVETFRTGVKNNIFFAVVVFVLLEIIIYIGIGRVTRRLEQEVAEQTQRLSHANQQLEQRNTELTSSIGQLKKTQAQLIESEKMASLGGLVAGVAHEINTPVGTSVTAASYLVDKIDDIRQQFNKTQMTRSDLDNFFHNADKTCTIILSNLNRAGDLVRSFKMVAVDQSSLQKRRFNLCEYLQEIRISLQPRMRGTPHQLIIECDHPLEIDCYPGALSQVLTNLVMNSLIHGFGEHNECQGVMKVEVVLLGKNQIELNYSDNGKGIAKSDITHIFEPFFTSNREGGSTGLGLNVVYNIITSNLGGNIRVESKVGEGTRFKIVFPMQCS
ncbi:MAG: hypothetical protein KZQ82_05755 [Candidatus Thiodiazotropha sp. (ex Lucinoma annulata)]|nr:hypothetical protein [Candidatus Thiodiazotropha sp. (ex Lucinoma borealis)]MCU7857703.1 hypothetical protein [Candidatus Thiodiazotropha sp. (ex Lucinoma borealis)]MCU7867924.1 hypothetical protein [Candidatus Thiodiazotropha sp. (ex Lucinoma borealis)]MCU7883688.1 hypothetical protein [Candidatus Thiodiazotropha sp. (ex Lucinoma annulata)]